MKPTAGRSEWGRKAAALYEPAYARQYRLHDEALGHVAAYETLSSWLREICDRFVQPIDVLDLGCGTGRYFCALSNVRTLIGVDASAAMLAEARHPVGEERVTAAAIDLVHGDLFEHDFGPDRFDFVYSVGVLAEHVPFDCTVVSHLARWLRADGRVAFTTVHPESPSVPQTLKRRLGRTLATLAPAAVQERIRERLLGDGRYADESRIEKLLQGLFRIETLRRFESEAHLHCWCVARKRRV
jgi:SAM-dependent methyltransferase